MEEYQDDGFIRHSNRSCKAYSLGQYDLKRKVSERTGKPDLVIEADQTDSRSYTPGQVEKQIETFFEMAKNK